MNNINVPSKIVRLSLPSKGRLSEDCLAFLNDCGLHVDKPNPRQYQAQIHALPDLLVLFQRPGDIVVSVRDGSVEFGITGLDVIQERKGENGSVLILHDALNFGQCALALAIPETWDTIFTVEDLQNYTNNLSHPLRVATKYPGLTGQFLSQRNISHSLISAEGTLETAPAIGYADIISDLVASGQTLRDNRLRPLTDGIILQSQAALIANKSSIINNPQALRIARYLLEFFEAHLVAEENLAIFANIRGTSPKAVSDRIFSKLTISGLQGPTVSRVYVREEGTNWYAINIIVRRNELFQAITELRSIGGSGVVVLPVTYIFDEEPPRYKAMLEALK